MNKIVKNSQMHLIFNLSRGLKFMVLFLALLTVNQIAMAQVGHDHEKIEAAKVSFFNQKLGLSSEEAKIFWPIYNDYQKELETLRKAHMQKMISFRKVTEIDDMSDAQIQALILNDFDFRQKDLNIEKKYYNKFKSTLPLKIVGKFYRAQEAFKRELLNQYRGGGPRRK